MSFSSSASAQVEHSLGWPLASPIHLDVSASSYAGRGKTHNEDHFYVTRATRSLDTVLTNLPAGDIPEHVEETNYFLIVADGMGGHAGGEVASRMAIRGLVDVALDIPDWIFQPDEEHAAEMKRRMRDGIQRVGTMLFECGRQDPSLFDMGSTLTLARICGHALVITHVGDSRAYLLRAGQLLRLTKDDTYVQMLVDIGRLSPEDMNSSGVRHLLTNALGGEQVQVAVDILHLEDGDRLLLCSDGLTDCVNDDLIAESLDGGALASEVCDRLQRLALARGARDDVTVVAATFGDSGASSSTRRGLRSLRSAATRLRQTYLKA